jgi:RsiW-degrading membrane proteinase PrsW (M82 family)
LYYNIDRGINLEEKLCCVCHLPIEGKAKSIGQRYFCDRHYNKAFSNRKGLWINLAVGVAALFVYAGIVALLDAFLLKGLSGFMRMSIGIILSLIPAAIWLVIFYSLDTLEPEPMSYIIGVFILGIILANGIALPVINGFFKVNDWLYSGNFFIKIVGSIFIIGFVQEYLKYAGVRFTVYMTSEFDERVDGIIYGAAIGLGFATMLNVYYVLSLGGVDLTIGAIRCTVASLAHASFGGISGYFLGRAKFEEKPLWWTASGVALAAFLNGVIQVLLREVSRQGLEFIPFYGLILAGVFAVIVFGVLFYLIKKINDRTLAGYLS